MNDFDFQQIEKKWQDYWSESNIIECDLDSEKPKFYNLCMYPYPSGDLHMGHVRNYTIGDVITRYKLLNGFNVLSPMGWDSFGLPAENAAIKTGIHPREFTEERIENMKDQIIRLGSLYDWDRELAAHSEDYYKWTQFLFIKLFESGLAYKKDAPVNWCDSCTTVLANEQVIDGNCERCDTEVSPKNLNQWFLKISNYSDELLSGLEKIGDWPENVKTMQKNWIGKSEGSQFQLNVSNSDISFEVFTTRPDTLFGMTFAVISPEHELMEKIIEISDNKTEIKEYIEKAKSKSEFERMSISKEKTGVDTHLKVINPMTKEEVPLWIADYVLINYISGTELWITALIVLVATLSYTLYGGLRASIFTDNIQMIVIGVLLFVLISIISSSSGDNFSFSLVNEKNPQLLSSKYTPGYTAGLTFFIAVAATNLFHQGNWQRVYAAKNFETLRKSLLISFFIIIPIVFYM